MKTADYVTIKYNADQIRDGYVAISNLIYSLRKTEETETDVKDVQSLKSLCQTLIRRTEKMIEACDAVLAYGQKGKEE